MTQQWLGDSSYFLVLSLSIFKCGVDCISEKRHEAWVEAVHCSGIRGSNLPRHLLIVAVFIKAASVWAGQDRTVSRTDLALLVCRVVLMSRDLEIVSSSHTDHYAKYRPAPRFDSFTSQEANHRQITLCFFFLGNSITSITVQGFQKENISMLPMWITAECHVVSLRAWNNLPFWTLTMN